MRYKRWQWKDLTQLISPTVAVYNRTLKKYLNVKNFQKIKGYPIERVFIFDGRKLAFEANDELYYEGTETIGAELMTHISEWISENKNEY